MKLTLSFNSVCNGASTLLSFGCSLEDADSSSNIFRAWKVMQALKDELVDRIQGSDKDQ